MDYSLWAQSRLLHTYLLNNIIFYPFLQRIFSHPEAMLTSLPHHGMIKHDINKTEAADQWRNISSPWTRARPARARSCSTRIRISWQSGSMSWRRVPRMEGWVEQDPMDIWSTQYAAMLEVLAAADVSPAEVAASHHRQRETTILWDRSTGRPVYNAIVWQCAFSQPVL